jgi:tetraacyldisaccharide 4'-kinase
LVNSDCNVIISDDGLQHYALHRDLSIAIIDAERGIGNGYCLPAGPLREPLSCLNNVDFIVNGESLANSNKVFSMQLKPGPIYNLKNPQLISDTTEFRSAKLHAVTGIGNPDKFFTTLKNLGLKFTPHAFPDHYKFSAKDFPLAKEAIITTEKDAVKLADIATENFWCLPVTAVLEGEQSFLSQIQQELLDFLNQPN